MSYFVHRLLLLLVGLVVVAPTYSSAPVVGILDTIDPWFHVYTFGPTMEHLRIALPHKAIKSVGLSFQNLEKAVEAGELDFLIAPSGFLLMFQIRHVPPTSLHDIPLVQKSRLAR